MHRSSHVIEKLMLFSAFVTVAVMPIELIDLAKGTLPFSLTPNLVSFACFGFLLLVSVSLSPNIKIRRDQLFFVVSVLLFWLIAGISVILADSDYLGIGPQRLVLLLIVASEAILITLWTLENRQEEVVFGMGGFLCLLICAGFMIIQAMHLYLNYSPATAVLNYVSSLDIVKRDLTQVGGLPMSGWIWWRLSGLIGDPNRAGVSCLVMGTLTFLFNRSPMVRILAVVIAASAMLSTLSRSALLFFIPLVLVWIYAGRDNKALRMGGFIALLIALIGIVWLIRTDFYSISQTRLSTEDYSTSTHLALIRRAIEITFEGSLKTFILGVGWGSDYAFCDDFFPLAGKLANFHSNIFSIMVQTGILGFVVWFWFSVLMPIRKSLTYNQGIHLLLGALCLSYLLAGIWYQYYFETTYWLSIALAALYKPNKEIALKKSG